MNYMFKILTNYRIMRKLSGEKQEAQENVESENLLSASINMSS